MNPRQDQTMNRRAAIGRGQLLRCLQVVPECGRLAAAELCGFFLQPPEAEIGVPGPRFAGSDAPVDHPRATTTEQEISSREIRYLYPVSARSFRPEPAARTRQPFAETELYNQDLPLPPTPPLQPWPRLWPYLRRVLGCQKESQRLDTRRLVQEVAQLRPIQRLPRLTFPTWAERACLIIDRRDALTPFWGDMEGLAHGLIRWRGREGLRACWITDGLPKGQAFDLFTRQACQIEPEAGAPVLVLSDLGCLDRDVSLARAWSELARHLSLQGRSGAALLPCPRDRWNAGLARLWNCACWDRHERLPWGSSGQRPRSLDPDQIHPEQRVTHLLPLLSPAVRVEPGLLRTLRLLIPPQLADAGTEFDVWHHAEAVRTPTAMALLPDSAIQHRVAFKEESTELKSEVARSLQRFHAGYAPTVRVREVLNLFECKTPLPSGEVKQARNNLKRMEDTLISLASMPPSRQASELAQSLGLFDWVRRELPRLSPRAIGQQGSVLWAAHQYWSGQSMQASPKGLDRKRVLETIKALREPGGELVWEIRQLGTELVLRPASSKPAGPRAFSIEAGAPLGWIRDRRRPFVLSTEDAAGKITDLIVRLYEAAEWRGPIRDSHHLRLCSDIDEVEFDSLPYPRWARRFGRDQCGLHAEFELVGASFRLGWISPGSFLMGSPEGEAGRYRDESPRHLVTISKGFWLAETPCTQAQWQAVMGKNPSHFQEPYEPGRPVESASWEDCRQFCARLRERVPDLDVRLPTEAEWEYACRAGTTSAFNDGSDCTKPDGKDPALERLGWHGEGEKGTTHLVAEKRRNAWGLYDMHGNVWEWCQDKAENKGGSIVTDTYVDGIVDPLCQTGSWRVVRGGSFWDYARYCRSASRDAYEPGYRFRDLGFRLAAGQPPGRGAPSQAAGGAVAPGSEAPAARPASGASRPEKKENTKTDRKRAA